MSQQSMQSNQDDHSAEEILWRAVIASTVQEWMHGHLRRKREAEKFLFQDDKDYQIVCLSAGINPQSLRERLTRIRERIGAMGNTPVLRDQTISST